MIRAEQIVRDTLAAALPPGSPMIFKSIERAAFDAKRTIVAHLTMFDGVPGVVRLEQWALGWSIGWDDVGLLPASLEDGAWRRVPELEPFA